jgi:hypothetical protein
LPAPFAIKKSGIQQFQRLDVHGTLSKIAV